ncbi:hypothetical protein HC928_01825 [bacterium]|nr:hypothetical protein [bacterium]
MWYQSDPARLIIEKRAMEARFPQFRLIQDGQKLTWIGKLESNRDNTYEIAVVYPDNFPIKPPDVYPIDPIITVWKDAQAGHLKHQYNDGKLCLYFPGDGSFSDKTTAATVVAVAAAWFFAYEAWLASGKREWPGIEAD